ncbi:hypothetical protein TELCIR_23839 [Teladorsagia circumcincta]|uniref:Root UVB sensitive protein C-terminal domain-containing protein n=1 Tax=Teladorsagia circumcincta TaxID=45464 RepID=A0A2G9TA81_TELCI|nr:hypothetical protein TELCIR_23839 [Teladorsagia circumcincta]
MNVNECNNIEPLFSSFGTRFLGCSLSHLMSYQNRVPSAKLRTTDAYTLLIDTRRNIGWIALADDGSKHSSLNAIFDLEALARDENRSEKEFTAFLDQLRAHKWRTDGNNLGFDEWTYSKK